MTPLTKDTAVKFRISCIPLGFLLTLIVPALAIAQAQPADFVFANGNVYTVNEAQPWAEAVVVDDNKIVYVGDTETAKGYIGEDTEFVELGGKMMLPGFVESHFHTTLGAAFGLTRSFAAQALRSVYTRSRSGAGGRSRPGF